MVIGVIGGIGAGKSTVLGILERDYHAAVYRLDEIAKAMYQSGTEVYAKLVRRFGGEILDEGQQIDLKKLSDLLYRNAEARKVVDAIVHPAVWKKVREIIRDARRNGERVCIEAALPTTDFAAQCDEVWFVYTEQEVRIVRLMQDRGYSRKKAETMIRAQIEDEDYAAFATFVINNSNSKEETLNEIYKHCERLQW